MKGCYIHFESRSIADVIVGRELLNDGIGLNGALITRINVPAESRGKGLGTELLKRILSDADSEQITLYLQPYASAGLTQAQLEAWYIRHGFEWIDDVSMARKPKGA